MSGFVKSSADMDALLVDAATIAGDTTSIDGKTPALGAAAAAAAVPVTLATEDAAKVPALGVAASAASSPVVAASDDAQLGSVGDAADADGNFHGQLRFIAESVDALPTSLGSAGEAASLPVALSTEDAAKVPALGSALAAASTPVIQASDSPQGRINAKGNTPVQITIADANSTQSAALPVGNYIVTSNIDVAILAGSNPTALTTRDPLWAYSYRRVVIATADDKVAAIRLVASTGVVTLTLEG